MLSRVADSVYWMSRYIERAENVARFIDVNYNLTLGEGDAIAQQWAPLVYTTGDHELFEELYGDATSGERAAVPHLRRARIRIRSRSCLSAARENARTIRETITAPMWEQINKFYLMVRGAARDRTAAAAAARFLRRGASWPATRCVGLTYTTMSHGEAWHFARLGRLMERADKTSRIVDVQYYSAAPDRRGRRVVARRRAVVGLAALGQCSGHVSPRARADHTGPSRRLSDSRSRFSPLGPLLPDAGPGLAGRDHGQPRRHVQLPLGADRRPAAGVN